MFRTKLAVALGTTSAVLALVGGAAACPPVDLGTRSDANVKRLSSAKARQLAVIRTSDRTACLVRTYIGIVRICR